MKKNTILKVLSFVLLLAVAISAVLLTGCGKQEDVAKQTDLEATNADLKAAKDEIAKLQTAIGKLQEASATSEALSQKVADLETALEAVSGDPEAIRGLVADIEAARADLQTAQEELGAAVQEATEALDALDEVYATDAQLADEISTLKNGVIKDLQTAVAALQGATGADEALGELTAIINDRLVKSDWIEATEVLFKGTEEPRSIASFEAGIVRNYGENPDHPLWRTAIQYEDEDVIEYEAKADLLAKKLLRAISVEDIDTTFALRNAEFAKLVKIVDKFEAELVEWEPERDADGEFIEGTGKLGFPSVVGDQLARLKYLHGLIEDRDLVITQAQENRYQALLAAVRRLARAEAYDLEIYRGPEDEEYPLIAPADHPTQTGLGLAVWDLVIYRIDTLINLNTIKGLYTENVAPLFTNPEETVFYAVGMKDLPYYINYLNKGDRYKELDNAKKAFEKKFPELTHFQDYNTIDPMLDAYEGIELIDGAWLDSWKETYKLVLPEEEVNCYIIIDSVDQAMSEGQEGVTRLGGYARVLAIRHFVKTLMHLKTTYIDPLVYKDPHEDITTKNLVGQIRTEVELGADKVLWAHVPTLDDIFAKQDAIYEEIDNLKHGDYIYNPKAACKRDLLGLDKLKNGEAILTAIRTRVETLKATMEDLLDLNEYLLDRFYQNEQILVTLPEGKTIEDLAEYKVGPVSAIVNYRRKSNIESDKWIVSLRYGVKMEDIKSVISTGEQYKKAEWVVSLGDGNYIMTELPDIVNDFFKDRGIYVDDDDQDTNEENYNVMTEFYRFNIKPYLEAAYSNITEVLKTIWRDVRDVVDKKKTYLPDLNKLITAQAEVFKLMAGVTADETDFVLEKRSDGDYYFKDFFDALTAHVVRIVELAQDAEKDAEEINEEIEALDAQFDLNKTAVVDIVSHDVVDWAKEYLGYLGTEPEKEYDKEYLTPGEQQAYLAEIAQYFVDTEIEDKTLSFSIFFVDKGTMVEFKDAYTSVIKTVANDGILNVYKYNNKVISSTEVYKFITGENFNALKTLQKTRVDQYKKAAKAWAEVDMNPTANRADIDASFVAFTDYVRTYYTNISTFEDECDAIEAYYGLVGEEKFHYEGATKVIDKTKDQDLAEKIAAKITEEATGSQGIKMKADRYASYIIDAQFGEDLAYGWSGADVDPELTEEEAYGEYYAYGSLCSRSYQYDLIMALAEKLDDQTVPKETIDEFEDDVRELKSMISDFREEFDYYIFTTEDENGEITVHISEIYNDAIDGANGERLDADLVAYVGAAKVYVINAFEKNQAESYLYVKDEVTASNGKTYYLPQDEDSLLTTYCVELIQKASTGRFVETPDPDEYIAALLSGNGQIEEAIRGDYFTENGIFQVDAAISVFRLQALKSSDSVPGFDDANMYRNFDYNSEDHFLEEVEEGGDEGGEG